MTLETEVLTWDVHKLKNVTKWLLYCNEVWIRRQYLIMRETVCVAFLVVILIGTIQTHK